LTFSWFRSLGKVGMSGGEIRFRQAQKQDQFVRGAFRFLID
jgi:hypothetical protein